MPEQEQYYRPFPDCRLYCATHSQAIVRLRRHAHPFHLVAIDADDAPTLIDLGASFPVASMTNVLTFYIAAAPNKSDIGVRVVEVSGAAVEFPLR